MMMTARSWGAAWMLFAMTACARESTPPPQKDSGKAAAKAEAKPAAPAPSAEPAPAAEPTTPAPTQQLSAESAPGSAAAAPVDPADPLGRKFADPAWFRRDMLEGAKAMDVSRSERTPAGLFSSQILFELPAGTTAEQCAEQLEQKVGTEVTNLARTPDEKAPGRIKISGETPRYRVTLMCGEAKGVMRAYVSFEWLS